MGNNVLTKKDYSLTGTESKLALQKGLAEANWYTSPVPREKMLQLLVRKNGPAIRDTLIWLGLIIGSGYLFYISRGHWWCILPYIIYTVLYASTSDSRWHESSHGTAFKSDWMNNVLYEISSFMVFRQSVPWRWSHTRHHSDTIIVGRDPEIAVPRPADLTGIALSFFGLKSTPIEFRKIVLHAFGKIDPEVATYLPKPEYGKVFLRARIYLLIYATVITASIVYQTILPLLFIGMSTFVGTWLMPIYGLTQHAGLDENVLDHRLNCRTVYMNRIHQFLYWNMNYHVEHHMFPLVPYHALPKLHELIKDDCPVPYKNITHAFREIIPTLIRQLRDPYYFVQRQLPVNADSGKDKQVSNHIIGSKNPVQNGWIAVCTASSIHAGDVLRFDLEHTTFAIYHTQNNQFYATDGICTHGKTHLADGLIIGHQIECAKHNGRFNIADGSVKRPPVCVALKTYPVEVRNGIININISKPGGAGLQQESQSQLTLKVISNKNVATYIRELTVEPLQDTAFTYKPGEYIQLEIPPYELDFGSLAINEPFREIWQKNNAFQHFAKNPTTSKRNYSLATNPVADKHLTFNVRLALPPNGSNISAGAGSSYVFNLKPGDIVKAHGSFGDFHIRESEREMVYIGGGAGMAPLRSHISYLFETLHTHRKVSFWYGARSAKELFYMDYFNKLALSYPNFSFHVALSEALTEDNWNSHTGFIHQIVKQEYLDHHNDRGNVEYYLCGPPSMIKATLTMLEQLGVANEEIAYDEF